MTDAYDPRTGCFQPPTPEQREYEEQRAEDFRQAVADGHADEITELNAGGGTPGAHHLGGGYILGDPADYPTSSQP